jgi:hypothetical protein
MLGVASDNVASLAALTAMGLAVLSGVVMRGQLECEVDLHSSSISAKLLALQVLEGM